jgi:hypothetical protein
MTLYKVWDELNSELEFAEEIEASRPDLAAELYAEQDADGHTDGLYQDTAQPISVQGPDGKVHRFEVIAEYSPTYTASEIK